MAPFAGIVVGMIGFSLGALLVAKIGRWLVTVYNIAREQPSEGDRSKGARLASGTVLSSGPWLIVAGGFFAYHVHSEAWAVWFLGGVVAAVVVFGFLGLHQARKASRTKDENAA